MQSYAYSIRIVTIVLCGAVSYLPQSLAGDLTYQKRGNYAEGRRDHPVASVGIELISVLAENQESGSSLAEAIQARFYLKEKTPVCFVVREKDNRKFYWLDKVQQDWASGEFNTFSWPTETVIKPMQLKTSDLGALVSLQNCKSDNSATPDRIAPVILYQNNPPAELSAYIFTYKLRSNAKVSLNVKALADGHIVFPKELGDKHGVFDVVLPAAKLAEGDYQVELTGYDLFNNAPVNQSVTFFHPAKLP
ncbi:MAG: hypothetical protein ABL919_13175 [Methylococcales bacterium]